MKVMVTGATGKLGRECVASFPGAVGITHQDMDLLERRQVFEVVKREQPDLVIHCAALTGIRQCEEDPALAWKTNVEGTEHLLDACQAQLPDCYFVHMSTPCVFYGDRGDYTETDIPHPKNMYSVTKLAAEMSARRSGLERCLTVRANFVAKAEWPYPAAFRDRFGTYLFADDVANALRWTVDRQLTGIVHICGKEKMSMYELAKLTSPDVRPMTMADYSGPPLTVDMSLTSGRIPAFPISEVPAPRLATLRLHASAPVH